MSSSEYLQRPALIDLRKGLPPTRARQFQQQIEFARVERGPARDTHPEDAHRAGLIEGEQRGRAAAQKELEPVIEQLRQAALALADLRRQRLSELEGELLEIARELARRILRGELRQDGDTVLHMARVCLAEAASQQPLRLRVSPRDLELVRAHLPELELDLTEHALSVQGDASIEPGCAVLETPTRCFDGRPERMLDLATRQLGSDQEPQP